MRKSAREQLAESKRVKGEPTVQLDLLGLATRILGGPPEPTQWEFICSPERYKLYMGRAGAAKTSTLMCGMILRALLEPGFKGVIMREDYNDMYDTVIQRFEEMVGRLDPSIIVDRNKSPPMRMWLRSAVDDSISYIIFKGMTEALPKGFEAHAIAVDEADECDEKHVNALKMRMRTVEGNKSMMLACNPPDKTHWLYTAATGNDAYDKMIATPWLTLFVPKDGENERNLEEGYYVDKQKGMPEDLRQRFIVGTWGDVFPGKPVYREFSTRLHVVDDLKHNPAWPILRFRDFGYRRPCCIWAQLDENTGCLDLLSEILGENEEVKAFESRVQAVSNGRYRGANFIDFGDPAVDQHKDTGSTLQLLSNLGVTVNYIRSDLDEGIRQVRSCLERLIQGRPQLQFSRKGTPILIRSMQGGYHMDDRGVKPKKDGYYDHLADALRYGIINIYDYSGGLKSLPQTSNFYGVTGLHGASSGGNFLDSMEYREDTDNG